MNNNNNSASGCLLGLIFIAIIIFGCWFFFNDISEDTNNKSNVPTTYTTVIIDTLFDDWYDNTAMAKEKYEGKYVTIINARLSSIDSNLKTINIRTIENSFIMDSITCKIKSETQKNYIKTLKSGDIIVVKGKITSVNDFGITLEVTEVLK